MINCGWLILLCFLQEWCMDYYGVVSITIVKCEIHVTEIDVWKDLGTSSQVVAALWKEVDLKIMGWELLITNGFYCTLKFFLPFFFKTFSKGSQMLKVAQELNKQILLLSNGYTTRVWYFSRKIRFPRSQVVFMGPHMYSRMLISSFKSCITSLLSQLLRWLKINYIG